MAVHIFIALLLHLKIQQEFLTAQVTLKRNEFVCRAKRKHIAVKKARALLSRPGSASQPFTCEKVVSPIRVTLPAEEARQLASPSCLAHLM